MNEAVSSTGVCVVTAGGPYPWIIINALADAFGPIDVIVEQAEPRGAFLRRRARKVGWLATAGQFGTMTLVRLGKKRFAGRIAQIVAENGLQEEPRAGQKVTEVQSVNAPEFLDAVRRLKPRVILLAGCRIMRADVLAALDCPVLNYHAGITPQYRGMNGGYWAMAAGDPKNFGGTVHLVDDGVDTGAVIYQARGAPGPGDNLMTYTHRVAAISRGICVAAVRDALEGTLKPVPVSGPSRQWYHPTIWQYIWTGLTRGVW